MNTKVTSYEESEGDIRFIRDTVFIKEQKVPPELEWDGNDPRCIHVLGTDSRGKAIGTGRIQPDGRIGRIAVLERWRDRGVGTRMLGTLLESARSCGLDKVHLHAQLNAVPFYENSGFEKDGKEFIEDGIPHINMTRDTQPAPERND